MEVDIGTNTETQLADKTVTSVTKGSKVDVTIKQVNADGAGPYTCDMDLTSNADGVSGQTNLTVTEKDSTGTNGNITLTVAMPADMVCIGGKRSTPFHVLSKTNSSSASTGNVCTVRCVNSKSFGGCFAVQQTDVTPNVNSPATIATAQTLEGVLAQVAENQVDLPAAIKANQEATTGTDQQQGLLGANALLALNGEATGVAAAVASSTSKAAKATKTATAKAAGGKNKGNNRRVFVA